MTHTPGPWYVANTTYQGLVVSEKTGENIAVTYDKKNAPLAAAAPTMRKALEDLLEWAWRVKGADPVIEVSNAEAVLMEVKENEEKWKE
jgi:hypothetical protein